MIEDQLAHPREIGFVHQIRSALQIGRLRIEIGNVVQILRRATEPAVAQVRGEVLEAPEARILGQEVVDLDAGNGALGRLGCQPGIGPTQLSRRRQQDETHIEHRIAGFGQEHEQDRSDTGEAAAPQIHGQIVGAEEAEGQDGVQGAPDFGQARLDLLWTQAGEVRHVADRLQAGQYRTLHVREQRQQIQRVRTAEGIVDPLRRILRAAEFGAGKAGYGLDLGGAQLGETLTQGLPMALQCLGIDTLGQFRFQRCAQASQYPCGIVESSTIPFGFRARARAQLQRRRRAADQQGQRRQHQGQPWERQGQSACLACEFSS